jgi:uncharacterized protein (DUF427 family)
MTKGHTITMTPVDVRVVVKMGSETLAESVRTVRLDETGLPARYYFPREDVRTDLLRRTNFETTCPFKGQASYWTLQVGDDVHDGLVWSYEAPIESAQEIAGLMSFYNDRVELIVDGDPQGGS